MMEVRLTLAYGRMRKRELDAGRKCNLLFLPMRDPILLEAIRLAGGPAAVGAALDITREAVQQWKRCPAERVIQLERLIEGQITRQELRPDLYPPENAAA